jgi:hypothetical protein
LHLFTRRFVRGRSSRRAQRRLFGAFYTASGWRQMDPRGGA